MEILEKRIIEVLYKQADDLKTVRSDAAAIALDLGVNPGAVQEVIVRLGERGFFVGHPYMEGTGSFVVELP